MRWARRLLLVAGCAVGLAGLLLVGDLVVGSFQPPLDPDGRGEGVLYTRDADGAWIGTRLAVVDDPEGRMWVQSGHHFRGWYERVLADPQVELEREGARRPYTAVPIDTPESEALVRGLLRERVGPVGFTLIRTFLLFADMKPVRLDPR
jgi:hypothetical protein